MVDLSNIPNTPGIYIFRDAKDIPIYIGKAINLRNRVRSYWQEKNWKERPKLAVLVPQIINLETIITQNEKEALILEASLIYKYQPKYNVLLKDNKSFPWIAITYDEAFPRLIPVRDLKWIKRKYPKAKLFGPYTDASEMYRNLQTARELFPLRKRNTPLFKYRPCLNYHLGKCLAPCQALVSEAEYEILLKQVEMFLTGRHEVLVEELIEKMQLASDKMEYEKAGKLRDQIKILNRAIEDQRIISDDPDCQRDLIGFACSDESLSIQIFKMRDGKLIGRESYFVNMQTDVLQTLPEIIFSSLEQAYLIRQAMDIPKEIFIQRQVIQRQILHYKISQDEAVQGQVTDQALAPVPSPVPENDLLFSTIEQIPFAERLENLLRALTDRNIAVIFPKRGEKKEQLELASQNAEKELEGQEKQKTKLILAIHSLQEALGLDIAPNRIDCFDISHLQGTEVVASCVRLKDGLPDKSKYRKIKLKIDQNNDFFSMKEAVYRRYFKSHPNKDTDIPDLIVIDGGKGQLSAACEAIQELNLQDEVKIISLAKKEEEVYTVDGQKIILPKNSPGLQTLQRARDEAHRFALTYNRQRRTKTMKESFLDNLAGIGEGTREKIKKQFTLKEIKKASPQEIATRLHLSANRADRIWQLIHVAQLGS